MILTCYISEHRCIAYKLEELGVSDGENRHGKLVLARTWLDWNSHLPLKLKNRPKTVCSPKGPTDKIMKPQPCGNTATLKAQSPKQSVIQGAFISRVFGGALYYNPPRPQAQASWEVPSSSSSLQSESLEPPLFCAHFPPTQPSFILPTFSALPPLTCCFFGLFSLLPSPWPPLPPTPLPRLPPEFLLSLPPTSTSASALLFHITEASR